MERHRNTTFSSDYGNLTSGLLSSDYGNLTSGPLKSDYGNLSSDVLVTTETSEFLNISSCPDITDIVTAKVWVEKYFPLCVYAVGIPGNILSLLVWIRPRMQHSSGVYLAALAVVDLLFLILHVIFSLETVWGIRVLNFPVICESFPVIFMSCQYLNPLLVLGFTVERYIAICHPFKKETYCTKERARLVTLSLWLFSFALGAVQFYFWSYIDGYCRVREEVMAGNWAVFQLWALITESFSFLFVPLCVLVLNVMVLREIYRKRFFEFDAAQLHQLQAKRKSPASTTVLLYVSFYFLLSTLPVSVVYITQFYVMCLNPAFLLSDVIVRLIGQTHFAVNFYIYFTTGKVFREETRIMFRLKS